MAKEKQTRERQPYRARELERVERNVDAYTRMHELAVALKWSQKHQDNLASVIAGLQKVGEGLSALPETFAPPARNSSWAPEEGDEVLIRDEHLTLYGLKKSPVCVVVAVNRMGDGPGARVHLRVESDDGQLVGQQSHFRPV